ncbi:M66 family metalloprotease [Aquimarina sp. 2201CG14-23]|uniref:M66 family metalloprotease n=1 Tax=Aquimarina mycalae TaxID=3040073 RepID=UPI002478209D|nr:M66 family metalloprotease [Aquimarina sp. 2201CG14-23]MDH7447083.1 M66 family metalloprotease [Aquimarina sp. 2201CG14-23]
MTNKAISFFALIIMLIGCSNDDSSGPTNPYNSDRDFEVFFAQTHVQHPDDEMFKLVSNKAALLKAQITSSDGSPVNATLELGSTTTTLELSGPTTPPGTIDLRPGQVNHNYEDSFTGLIPKEWVQPGLKITIQSGNQNVIFDNLKIGAPNKVILTMFDAHFFESSPGDYPTGWKEELEAKWPASEIELKRIPNIIFNELTVPPRRDANAKATRVSSTQEYQDLNGVGFDGEQATASQWNRALKAAAGTKGRVSLFYVNIYGVPSGGQAGGFGGVGNGKAIGILHHELGHALSLPHWGNNQEYPYKGNMHGISAPDNYKNTHAGPTWAFDIPNKKFIPPTVQSNAVGGTIGVYKQDPMQGGGTGDQEEGFLLRHFSDYSVFKMQNYLEGHVVIWNQQSGNYASWDDTSLDYSNTITNDGVSYAIERNIEVISVMAGVSSVTPQANIIYNPIGPYTSGIIDLFDPTIEDDRLRADAIYCPQGGCDVSLRIVQGGVTKVYMLPIDLDNTLDPLDSKSFKTRAVNLRASNGTVSMIELLSTPDAEKNGLPTNPTLLDSWSQ